MNLAEWSIKNSLLSIIVILLALFGGWSAYQTMPRFEDPEFTIRIAQIFTQYPGASPEQVAEEVTEPLETAIQQLQEVKSVESVSSAGVSEIKVEIKYEFSRSKSDLSVIWGKLRNKVKDAERALPPGATAPAVYDDFGDVYGLLYALTGDGYSLAELERYAKSLQRELLQIPGVAKVVLAGNQQEAIYVEISRPRAAGLGVTQGQIFSALQQQGATTSAGTAPVGDQRLVLQTSGAVDSVAEIENLLVATADSGRLIYLSDVADVRREYMSPPSKLVRYNGKPAITLGVSNVTGSNVAAIGRAVEAKIESLEPLRPLGIELHEFYHQGKIVESAVQDFVVNVIAAVAIVVVTLLIFMGLRSGLIIGAILILIIAATLLTMNLSGIPMHRISLGALIIALGMMVDNAIVVTDGILVGTQRGRRKLEMAKEIVAQSKWPLLGGTLVGIIAFAPIGFAPGDTAEYTGHLFWVIMISLLFSWIFALTLTPLFCYWLFPEPEGGGAKEQKESGFARAYKAFLRRMLAARVAVVGVVVALFALAVWGFTLVKPGFFPSSTTPQMVVDYWLPQGVDIRRTEQDMVELERFVRELESVNAVQTLVGGGALRYMLVYGGESPNPAYGQILARVDDYRQLDSLMPKVRDFVAERFPDGQAKVWRFVLGPGGGSKIEATFKGPDPAVLRQLADQAKAIMVADGQALFIKDDWRQRVSVVEALYSEPRGRRAGVSREDVAAALETNFVGQTVGAYIEGDKILPIVYRAPAEERSSITDIEGIQVLSPSTGRAVPITQVTNGFRTFWRDAQLRREDRILTIKAQCDPAPGLLASELQARLQPQIEAMELPAGYTLEWDGEAGSSAESNDNLASTLPMGFLAMVLVVVVLFGALRQPLVIWLVVPLALVGVVAGLLTTGTPMEFMAILGVLSLSGLLIKNAIVLVEKMDSETRKEGNRFEAVIESASSRVRPVMMGTLTTVLGVIPLFSDVFFKSMAVVLVFGLTFATLLTLVIVPVLYSMFFGISKEASDATP